MDPPTPRWLQNQRLISTFTLHPQHALTKKLQYLKKKQLTKKKKTA